MAATAGFEAFVVEHEGPLLRTAYLLTGDRDDAEELLTAALASTHRRWRRVAAGDPVGTVRRAMVRGLLRPRHRPSVASGSARPSPRPGAPSWSPDDAAAQPTGTAQVLRQALLGLPPRTRAALVLRLHDGLTEAATADALGCAPDAVGTLTDEGTAVLRARGVGGGPVAPAVPPTAPPARGGPATAPTGDDIYRRPR